MRHQVVRALVLCAALATLAAPVFRLNIFPILHANFFRTDFVQDYLGARALIDRNAEPYPILSAAVTSVGLVWQEARIRSTHPPTAFLLALPFGLLQYRVASLLWMAAMFGCIVLSARALGLGWAMSLLAAALSLAWPPTIWSLSQFTAIWMLGLVLAYRFRHRGFASGVLIGIASLPKFLAAPAVLYHVRRRQWTALAGFAALWLGALALLLLLRADSLSAYLADPANSASQIRRMDNGALAVVAWRVGGWAGLAGFVALSAWVLWTGWRRNDWASWACFVWLGIAFLPITWVYSLLPLLPWLLLSFKTRSTTTHILAAAALFLPFLAPVPGSAGGWMVALCTFVSGLVFVTLPDTETEAASEPEYAGHQAAPSVPSRRSSFT